VHREFPFEEVEAGQEIVGTCSTLETLNQLQKNSIDPVSKAGIVPVLLIRMLLALLQ